MRRRRDTRRGQTSVNDESQHYRYGEAKKYRQNHNGTRIIGKKPLSLRAAFGMERVSKKLRSIGADNHAIIQWLESAKEIDPSIGAGYAVDAR